MNHTELSLGHIYSMCKHVASHTHIWVGFNWYCISLYFPCGRTCNFFKAEQSMLSIGHSTPLGSYGQLIPVLVSDYWSELLQISFWTPFATVLGLHTGEKVPTDSWFQWRQAGIGRRGWAKVFHVSFSASGDICIPLLASTASLNWKWL